MKNYKMQEYYYNKETKKKSGKNQFAGFSYYELADFMPSINDIFYNVGLFSMFNIRNDIATLVIVNMQDPTDTITFESPIAEATIKGSTPIQCLGGIHTYMKRYLYLNALEIVESDMFDAKVGDKKDPLVEGKAKIEKNYRDELVKYCNDNNVDMNAIAQKYKLNAKSTNQAFKAVLETLEETNVVSQNLDSTIVGE
jgi:hypothetical protein